MRSKNICSLASALAVLAVLLGDARDARADVTRLRISITELPLQEKPMKVDAKNAVLPNGVSDHGPIPKTWRKQDPAGTDQIENARCTDDRRASVTTIYGTTTSTAKIWEADGKTWLDTAEIETAWLFVEVKKAERIQLGRIADGLWGYRRKDVVVVVAARDNGFIEEGGFYECRIAEHEIASGGGTTTVVSSPKDVNDAMDQIAKNFTEPGKTPKRHPEWTGLEFRVLASVSKSSSDATPMLSLVIKKP